MNKKIEQNEWKNYVEQSHLSLCFLKKLLNLVKDKNSLSLELKTNKEVQNIVEEFKRNLKYITLVVRIKKRFLRPRKDQTKSKIIILAEIINDESSSLFKREFLLYFFCFAEFLHNNLKTNSFYLITNLSPKIETKERKNDLVFTETKQTLSLK